MVPDMKSKPAALRAARERQGHTITALAALSRVSKQRISDLETSPVGILPPTALRLADALGVDIEDIASITSITDDESDEVVA
jgi:transcriptional regulator with XRE-family HTH domain